MNNKIIDINKVSCSIDGNTILKEISLSFFSGEFIGVIGPNGAGKTTLLKCINRLLDCEGEISIFNQPIKDINYKKIARKIAFMHQDTSISFPFSVENIILSGRFPYKGPFQGETKEDYLIAKECMEFTDTLNLKDKFINCLSGGERQRVFFAKTLAQQTDIILLDEPSASLDIAHEQQIFSLCKEICNKGKTVIAAVHDLRIASRFCSRLVLLNNGRVISDGRVDEVLTSDNLNKAYKVNSLVYKNEVTGLTDYHII